MNRRRSLTIIGRYTQRRWTPMERNSYDSAVPYCCMPPAWQNLRRSLKRAPRFRPTKEKGGGLPKSVVWGAVALVLIFILSFGYLIFQSLSHRLSQSVATNVGAFQLGVEDVH